MSLAELIQLVQAKLAALNVARSTAASLGDINQIILIDAQIVETQLTLDQLNTLV
jgi:hypothetical protein